MARRFAKVSEEEIEEAFFYPSDLVNTKTTILLRVDEERWIYLDASRLGMYPPLFTSPSGDSCIIFICLRTSLKDHIVNVGFKFRFRHLTKSIK